MNVTVANPMLPLKFDTTPPTVSITSPKHGFFTVDTIHLEFVVTKPATWSPRDWDPYKGVIGSVCYVLDGAWTSIPVNDTIGSLAPLSFSVDIHDVQDGNHKLFVNAYGYNCYVYEAYGEQHRTDVSGNSETWEFRVEANAPQFVILKPENKSYIESDIDLIFRVSEETKQLSYILDSQPAVSITGNTTFTGLEEGTHTVVVYATDKVGKSNSSGALSFTVDKTAPKISVSSVQVINGTDAKFDVSINEPVSLIVYCLDKGENKTFPENRTLADLSETTHNVTFCAWDLAGNKGTSETFTFSMTEPSPPPVSLALVSAVPTAFVATGVIFYVWKKRHKPS
jgi:hypothetical protein